MGILGCPNGASYIYAALRRMRGRWVELPSSTVLCKHVCGVLVTVYEEDTSILPGDDFSNIMIPDVNMFGVLLGDRVRCDED